MTENTTAIVPVAKIMETIGKTKPQLIGDLEFVKKKYIDNYNFCHNSKDGEMMYFRNSVHFKQIVAGSDALQSCDSFSFYACFVTVAVNGYSLDPSDNEVYLIARGGKCCLDKQAGAYVKKLLRTNQATKCLPAKIVYRGDQFHVEDGVVVKHVETFETDEIIAGYVKFLDSKGGETHFIYRRSDWESWRKKSPNPKTVEKKGSNNSTYLKESLWDNGIVGGTQPEPNFLKTKFVKHAAKDKSWSTGNTPAVAEYYPQVEYDSDEEGDNQPEQPSQKTIPVKAKEAKQIQGKVAAKEPEPEIDDSTDDSFTQVDDKVSDFVARDGEDDFEI